MKKKVIILGAGESGVGAALLAKQKGYDVFVSEYKSIKPHFRKTLTTAEISFEENGHSQVSFDSSTLIIKSPGIPTDAPVIQQLRASGNEIISEIEFAARHTKAKIIAITGSNGKTTTTTLIYHMMKQAGCEVVCAGNIGQSFAGAVATIKEPDYYVLEVSSFQLDNIQQFQPDIAILLNITPDHLDRYEYKIEKYAEAKFKIAQNLTKENHFIYCLDDPITMEFIKHKSISAKQHGFSVKKKTAAAWLEGNTIHAKIEEDQMSIDYTNMKLTGQHNMYNTMAAAIVSRVLDLRKKAVRESFEDFLGVEHRLEKVASIRGIEFINDSKATNVNAAWYALESMVKPTIWIAGGVDKGNDYEILVPLVDQKVKSIILLGENVKKIHEAFSKKVDMIINAKHMEEAVKLAYHLGDKGDTVLLSPACASFDLFENYEDRGRQFKAAVKEL